MRNILSVLFILVPLFAAAQEFRFQQEFDTIPVEINGWHPAAPWTGGDSETAPEFCDIDADGDYDCFIGNMGYRITYYENIGSGTNPQFKYRTRFFGEILLDSVYSGRLDPTFVDIDYDSDFDLFSGSPSGIIHYWNNIGSPQNSQFALITDSLEYIDVPGYANLAFLDIDSDNDYDLFIGDNLGYIHYYQNIGTPEVFDFELVTSQFQDIDVGYRASPCFVDIDTDGDADLFIGERYGKIWFYRNDSDSTGLHFTYITDNYNNIDVGDAASPDFVDLEGDGDYDLVIGRNVLYTSSQTYGDVVFYTNIGTPQAAEWELLSEQYLTWDIQESFINRGCDIDADSDYDLFLLFGGPDLIGFYENIGDSLFPSFLHITDSYFDIPVPSSSFFFTDIDDDLDYDLFVGRGGFIPPPYPGAYLFRNIGTPRNAIFSSSSMSLVPGNYNGNIKLALTDIDADGDEDLFMADHDGVFYFCENVGSSTSPNFVGPLPNWQGISTSGGREMCFYDIDQDGDFDLFLCNGNYNKLTFYINAGTPQNPDFQFETSQFFGNDVELLNPGGIDIADIDADGDGDFIFSGSRGGMMFFRNITGDTAKVNNPNATVTTTFSILPSYPNPFNSVTTLQIELPQRSKVKLEIFNIRGQRLGFPYESTFDAGWQKIKWDASKLTSGIYFYRMSAEGLERGGSFRDTGKLLLLK